MITLESHSAGVVLPVKAHAGRGRMPSSASGRARCVSR